MLISDGGNDGDFRKANGIVSLICELLIDASDWLLSDISPLLSVVAAAFDSHSLIKVFVISSLNNSLTLMS